MLRGIFHVVSGFPLHFMLYRGKLEFFSDSVAHLSACPEHLLKEGKNRPQKPCLTCKLRYKSVNLNILAVSPVFCSYQCLSYHAYIKQTRRRGGGGGLGEPIFYGD